MTKVPALKEIVTREQLVDRLRAEVRRLEGTPAAGSQACFSSGCPALDRLLPERGWPDGVLVEWLADGSGGGAGMLALMAAWQACREGGWLVVLDRQRQFYPPAAAAAGIDLQRVMVIHARQEQDELWALDQALRCPAVGAVWAPLGRLDGRRLRRLQLAAEDGRGIGCLLRPAAVRGQPSWAAVQLLVEPLPSGGGPWRLRVELLRCRGGSGGGVVELAMDEMTGAIQEVNKAHEKAALHLAAQLAHPTPRGRSARA